MLLNNEWVNNEVKKENKRYLQPNENENTTIQNLCDTETAILRGKFIAFSNVKKQEKPHKNNLTLHLKEVEKEQQTKIKVSRRMEIIKIIVEINKIES